MKTVARLLLTYWLGTPAAKWLTISGLLLIMASLYVVLYLPQTERMTALAVPGLIAFFLASSLMPLTVGRLSQGHAARLLPGVRVKLLASATLAVLLAALPVGLLTPLAYIAGMSADAGKLFEDPRLFEYTVWLALFTYTSACIAAAWLYVLIWFITSERNMVGFLKASVVLLALWLIPSTAGREPAEGLQANLEQLAVFFTVFSSAFLAWPRIRRWRASRQRPAAMAGRAPSRELAGSEVDLILGNARPWVLVGALSLPMVVVLHDGSGSAWFWLFYLSIASIVAGGNTERAPARSRALWLRSEGSRAALFASVERSAWRHNGFVMLALLLILLGISSYTRMPTEQLATAAPLIVLGTALSTYLGLLLTRGVRIVEALLAIAVMAALMLVAAMAADGGASAWLIGGSLATLAGLAVALRVVAKSRWARIDWSACRGDTQRALRTG